jgi:subtilase family serine protease
MASRRWGLSSILRVACACLVAGVGLAIGITSAAGASSQTRVRLGELPRLSAHTASLGTVAGGTPIHITVALKARDPAALAAYAKEVATPGSDNYRIYLSAAQFARRFGASAKQISAVDASLREHGLRPGSVSANHLSIPVLSTASGVERAFSLRLEHVQLAGGQRAVVASAAPEIDTGIAGDVQAVLGLESVSAPHPLMQRPSVLRPSLRGSLQPRARAHIVTGGPQPCAAASTAASQQGAYTADQLASAYHFSGLYGAGDEGQGVTIAIYELEPDDPGDIAAYQSCYGTNTSVSYIPVDGGAGSGAGSGEATLDIEQVIGLAPRATVLVYQGPNAGQTTPGSGPYDLFNTIVSQDRAQVVSISWGQCEQLQGASEAQSESTLFEEAAIQGQTFVAATGDDGSEDCNDAQAGLPDTSLAVDDPGSQPFVTGVGGTTMTALGPPPTETVWNNGGNAASLLATEGGAGGGGVSVFWKMPGYQANAPAALHVTQGDSSGSPCANSSGDCREVPDVSADADPNTGYIVYWNGSGSVIGAPTGWQAVGGTSAAAPLWAALLADVDAAAACHGSPIGFANPALYRAAASNYGSEFNDIASGNNDLTGTNNGLYPAGVGYDMASGLGTPDAAALAPTLCADALRVADPGAQTSVVGQKVSLQIKASAPAGAKLTYYASHLPAGLSISGSDGKITGKPKSAGQATVGVAALDQTLALRGVNFSWTVEGRPVVSQESLTKVGSGHPKLALTVTAGRYAPALKSIAITLHSGLKFSRPARHITLTAGGKRVAFRSQVVGGRLLLTLHTSASAVKLTVSSPSLTVPGTVSGHVRAHQAPRIEVTVVATDLKHRASTLTARIKPRS